MQTYEIPKEILKKLFDLNNEQYINLLKVFNCVIGSTISFKQLQGFEKYLLMTNHIQSRVLHEKDYKSYLTVQEEPKEVKEYKSTPKVKKIVPAAKKKDIEPFFKIKSYADGSKKFSSEYKNIYYSLKPVLSVENCVVFDTTLSYAANIKKIKALVLENQKIYLYTNNSNYEKEEFKVTVPETKKKLGRKPGQKYKPVKDLGSFKRIMTKTEASKIYNKDLKKIYYAGNSFPRAKDMILFDLSKNFKENYAIAKNDISGTIFLFTDDIIYSKVTYRDKKDIGRDIEHFKMIDTQKKASRVFNSESKIVYYCYGAANSIDDMIIFDLSKNFTQNLKDIKAAAPEKKRIFFYTDNEHYSIKDCRSIEVNKFRIFKKEEDEKILSYYNSDYYSSQKVSGDKNPYTLDDLCEELKIGRKLAASRAAELGFQNFKRPNEKPYIQKELDILKKYQGKKTVGQIKTLLKENGFTRSILSIRIKMNRLDMNLKLDGSDEMNVALLAKAFGVDAHFFDDNNRLEKLNAIKAGKGGKGYTIKRVDIKNYIVNNPYDFNISKVEPKFFIELLAN